MFANHSSTVYELLRNRRLASAEELDALRAEHVATGKPLAALAIDGGLVDQAQLLALVAESAGCRCATDLPDRLPEDLIALLTAQQARTYHAIPSRANGQTIDLLVSDPFDRRVVDDLAFVLGREIRLVLADAAEIDRLIATHYGPAEATLDEVLAELGPDAKFSGEPAALSARELEALARRTPIVRFVDWVLSQAVRAHASDVHFEPFEREFKIRYRVDGALHELTPPPRHLALPITSRLKVLAGLDIAERRLPQDGRLRVAVNGHPVDLRVSTLPTQFGESVVLRVLDRAALQLDLGRLGLPADVHAGVGRVALNPHGIVVVTGPTGSGKTTTLYSVLQLINASDTKILTVEDPVEYEIDGIMQVPVNPIAGLTFASALRAFLRQDPDVIMVGEIRDLETAQIAVQASLTGHLVLTTLHTNDATSAVTRLIDMGVEPFLIASTLEAVLAQRLVRRLCPDCRRPHTPSDSLREEIGLPPDATATFFEAVGCHRCSNTGYRGRLGLFEWLEITEEMRELIGAGAPLPPLREAAKRRGLRTLREEGVRAALAGATTLSEVLRHT